MAKKKDRGLEFNPNLPTTMAEPRDMIGDIPVFCSHDELVDIKNMVGNPRNPNKHPQDQLVMLAQIIKGQGWRAPITVSKRSGYVVKGHGRLAAAKLLELEKVPVDYQNYASEAEEYADLIADNRIAELADMDTRALLDLIQELDTGEVPVEFTGYSEEELQDLIHSFDEKEPKEKEPEEPEGETMIFTLPFDVWLLRGSRLEVGESVEGVDVIIKAFIKDQSIANVKLIRNGEQFNVQKIIEHFN